MTKKRRTIRNREVEHCSFCDKPGVEDVRIDRHFKGILIENLPAKHCPHCNEYYFDHETVGLIEEIVKNPKRYAQKLKRPVARVA
jgi:YgiT-type zinc finger domain-containing protein